MKKGFTLLEMIVVVMIVSILFILTIPNISKVIKVVDHKGCKALTKVVDAAIVEYKLEYDVYPSSLDDLVIAGYLSEDQLTCPNGDNLYYDGEHTTY